MRWIAEHQDASVFHTTSWARVLAETYGFKPCYFASLNPDGTRLLLPMAEVDSWLTGRRGISLPFSDFCPPLGDRGVGIEPQLFDQICRHGRARRWRYLELRGRLPARPDARESLRYYTHDLRLDRTESEIFQAFHPAVRRAIRKAEKSGLTVEVTTSSEAIEDYFKLQEFTRRRHGLPPQPVAFFRAIHEHVLTKGMGFIVRVRHQDRAVASAIFFHHGSNGLFKFGASNEAFQALRPTNLALWTAIRECRQRGVTLLSFGRNAIHHESLRRFKLSWGTTEGLVAYSKFDCVSGRFLSDRSLINGWQNHLFRRLPLPLGRLIGAMLYRHVA